MKNRKGTLQGQAERRDFVEKHMDDMNRMEIARLFKVHPITIDQDIKAVQIRNGTYKSEPIKSGRATWKKPKYRLLDDNFNGWY